MVDLRYMITDSYIMIDIIKTFVLESLYIFISLISWINNLWQD
jgi:hypothetical protein